MMTQEERDALRIESATINPKKAISLLEKIPAVLDEHDRWKARAEALERALKTYTDCQACRNGQCYKRNGRENCNWQFNESRFAGKEEKHERCISS